MLLFSTHKCIAVCLSLPASFGVVAASAMGTTSDFDDPDRAVIDMIVLARHSAMLGAAPEID